MPSDANYVALLERGRQIELIRIRRSHGSRQQMLPSSTPELCTRTTSLHSFDAIHFQDRSLRDHTLNSSHELSVSSRRQIAITTARRSVRNDPVMTSRRGDISAQCNRLVPNLDR